MVLGKWEDPNLKEQIHWVNQMVKGKIGEFTRKSLVSREELWRRQLEILEASVKKTPYPLDIAPHKPSL